MIPLLGFTEKDANRFIVHWEAIAPLRQCRKLGSLVVRPTTAIYQPNLDKGALVTVNRHGEIAVNQCYG